MDAWTGRTLSKVRIEQPLGRGGMAEVYLGRHTTLDRPVAVKILHGHLQEDSDLRRRFEAEAQAVAALRHPNIVQVYDFDVVEERPYIVMELLEGLSLGDYLASLHETGLTLSMGTINRLMDGLASALDYAHQRGIIHRDVKPANIMLRRGEREIDAEAPLPPDVEPILTDFGVARLAHSTAQTATGTVLGTPAYMSPEQVRGDEIDSRSDIYSLAIVLYEMLSGRVPFNDETTPAAVLMKHLNEEPPPVPQANPAVQQVLEKGLAKDPDDRFQRAGGLAKALERAAVRKPSAPSPRPAAPPEPTAERSFPQGCWIAGALAALGLIGVLVIGSIVGLQALGLSFGPQSTAPAAATATPGADAGATSAGPPAGTDQPVPSEPVGRTLVRGPNLSFVVNEVPPPPPDFSHRVWLESEGGGFSPLGLAQLEGSELSFSYAGQQPILPQLGRVLISLESVEGTNSTEPSQTLYAAELPEETAARIALLTDVTTTESPTSEVPAGLSRQATHYNSHHQFALEAIRSGDLAGGKLHSEHVINIIEGREGADYGDWNNDGRVENPGDDVGLLPYLHLLDSFTAGAAAPEGEINAVREIIGELIDQTERARDLSTRVASADTLEEVEPLVEELNQLQIEPQIQSVLDQTANLEFGLALPVFPIGSAE